MTDRPPLIQFKDVSFGYDHLFTLQNIDFSIFPGDFVGVIGPNGSGKTTVLKLMLGMLQPNEGTVEIFGTQQSEGYLRMGYVPQRLNLDPKFPISVMELVLSGRLSQLPWYGRYQKEDKQAALDALETVKLTEFKNQPFGTLSTGQAQRALIARALAGKPELLILDEPTANVDPNSSADIHRILKNLAGEMTVVMVTHDLRTVIHDTQKVLCVQDGVTELSPDQVCEHFAYGLYHTPLIQGAEH
ncbi:MAG: High-affinity zinc uptake system ATP-binding protein ZnuC [Chlamydiae bacterium]|nr:High-affinity zinc uptake system ATP-binding protein ZnuC [Chlamydiota bacterium]